MKRLTGHPAGSLEGGGTRLEHARTMAADLLDRL